MLKYISIVTVYGLSGVPHTPSRGTSSRLPRAGGAAHRGRNRLRILHPGFFGYINMLSLDDRPGGRPLEKRWKHSIHPHFPH